MARREVLTPRERAFVEEYLRNGQHATNAYRAVYPKAKGTPDWHRSEAHRILRQPDVAAALAEADKAAAVETTKVMDQFAYDRARVATELARLSFSNMQDFVSVKDGQATTDVSRVTREQWAAVGEFVVDEYQDGKGETAREVKRTKVKLSDKRTALEALAKLHGWIIDRKEVRKIKSWADLMEDELEALTNQEPAQTRD